ncbi:MSMEG_6728 family protein [Kribbella deserti]|uniref:MSMEG_6728 family protein n=1 Tax=Kribbella deserti TaxID=1926257 RepID=A0ABV6QJ56_9ACTN
MQTFVPYADFAASAAVLDDRRLGKQRVETLQILRALVWPDYGWKHHPAVGMWRGFTRALVGYGTAVCREWGARGHTDSTLPTLLEFTGGEVPEQPTLAAAGALPPWLGEEAVHLSHRSALLRKDPTYYGPIFPGVPDDLPYLWPRPAFPRWPVRRTHEEGLSVEEAAELLGVTDLSEDEHRVLVNLRVGYSGTICTAPQRAGLLGLLAGWCTPGRTLWLLPGEPVRAESSPHPLPAWSEPARPGIARPAGPREIAATRDEWSNDPEFVFRRVSEPLDDPGDAGLVVLDGNVELRGPRASAPVLRLVTEGPHSFVHRVAATASR